MTSSNIRMTVEDFKKLAEKHLFVLEELTINKEGVKEMQIFGFDALYEQLRIYFVVEQSEQLVCYKKCGDTQPYNDICLNCGSSINYDAN